MVPDVSTATAPPIAGHPVRPRSTPRPATAWPRSSPRSPAAVGMGVVHRASGFSGTLVRIEGGGVELRGRTGLERVFRLAPGAFSVDGRAVTLVRAAAGAAGQPPVGHRFGVGGGGRSRRPGWPGRVGSGSRASTTPSWSSGCGATTCGSRGSSSSAWTASTTWRRRSATFRPGPGPQARRAGRPPGRRQQGVADRRGPPPSRRARHRHTRSSTSGRRSGRPSSVSTPGPHPHGPRVEDGRVRGARLRRPPDGLAADPGLGLAPTPTSSRPWWARSSASSTSSPRPTESAGRRCTCTRRLIRDLRRSGKGLSPLGGHIPPIPTVASGFPEIRGGDR